MPDYRTTGVLISIHISLAIVTAPFKLRAPYKRDDLKLKNHLDSQMTPTYTRAYINNSDYKVFR